MRQERPLASDEELACETQAGSGCAFEELVFRYEKRIFAFLAQSCSPSDAAEITQDTFIRAYRGIDNFNANKSWATWLFAIARNRLVDHLRLKPVSVPDALGEEVDVDDPAELLARKEDQRHLWGIARRQLPDLQYQALWLRYAEHLDVPQIARILRKTRPHVKVMLFRARQTLARHLGPPPVAREPASAAAPLGSSVRIFPLVDRKMRS